MKKIFLLLGLITTMAFGQVSSATLKAQIDTQITNKTGANSISKANVGNNLKAIIDYADQEKFAYKGDWTSGTNYKINDIVTYWMGGSSWLCVTANAGVWTPEQSSEWKRLGMSVISTTTAFTGNGTFGNPISLGYYYLTQSIYATGTNAPQNSVNYFNGMSLPEGVTMTKVRTGVGTYEIVFSGASDIPYVDVANYTTYKQIRFFNNPDIRLTSIYGTGGGSTKEIRFEFQNKPGGTLTDGFSNLSFEIRFY